MTFMKRFLNKAVLTIQVFAMWWCVDW